MWLGEKMGIHDLNKLMRMSDQEINQWHAFYDEKHERQEAANKKARQNQ